MNPNSKIMWLIERILDYVGQGEVVRNWRENKKRKTSEEEYRQEIGSFLKLILGTQIKYFEIKGGREDVYRGVIENNFTFLSELEKELLVTLTLCYYSRQIKDTIELEKIQNTLIRKISFLGLQNLDSDDFLKFLRLYHNFKKENLSKCPTNKLFEIKEEIDYESTARRFFDEYYKLGIFYIDFPKKDQLRHLEEMNKTFLFILERGRLNAYGVNQEALEKIQKEMSNKKGLSNTYLILGNKLSEKIKQQIKKSPGIGGFRAYSNIPSLRKEAIAGFIIKTESYYSSPEDFLQKIIDPVIDPDQEIILSIMEIDSNKKAERIFPINRDFSTSDLKECSKTLKFIEGERAKEQELWILLSKVDIKLSKLLPLLPFTVLVKDLEDSERVFLIENYVEIRQKSEVERLQDWSDKEPNEIVNILNMLGAPKYNEREIKKIFSNISPTKSKINDRLIEISKQVIKNSKKFDWMSI